MSNGLYVIGRATDDSTVRVWWDGAEYSPEDRDYRQRYGYSIETPNWRYDGNDIRSGCSAGIDVEDAARTLFSFLGACAESREHATRTGDTGENADLFPEHVGLWAEENSDEISLLSIDPAELDD